jgi:antirestriction protein
MENPRIYVASLSDYNNGRLEGKWFDLSDYSNGSDLMDAINEMLEEITEKYNDGEVREEWAVHDYEYIPSSLASEYMGENEFQQIYDIMEASEENNIPFEVLIERVGDVGSDDYGNIAESLFLVVDGNDETDIVFELEQQMGELGNDFWKNHTYIDDVTQRVMYGEDVDRFREDIGYENTDMSEDEIETLAEERADEEESRRNDDLIEYLEEMGYSDIPSFVSKNYESAWNDLSMDYDVINYEDKMYVFSNNYGFGGGLLVGSLVGAYLGYKVGKYNKQTLSSGFDTEKRIGKDVKNKLQGKKSYGDGGGVGEKIPNNYLGKSPIEIWNTWSIDQRKHFLDDHSNYIDRLINNDTSIKKGISISTIYNPYVSSKQKYVSLNKNVKQAIKDHIKEGQYEDGGGIDSVKWVKTFEEDDVDKQYPFYVAQYQGFELTLYQNYNKIWGIVIEKDGKVVLRRGEWVYSLKEAKDSAIDFADEINNKFDDGGGVGEEKLPYPYQIQWENLVRDFGNYNVMKLFPSGANGYYISRTKGNYSDDATRQTLKGMKPQNKKFDEGGSVWEKNGFSEFPKTSPKEWELVEWSLNGNSPSFKGRMYFQANTGLMFIAKENGEIYKPISSNKLFWRKEKRYDEGGGVEDISKSLSVNKLYDQDGNLMGYTIKDKYNVNGKYTLSNSKEQAEENLQFLIDNPSRLSYYRKNEYDEGGNVDTISQEDLLRIKLAVSEAENRIKANDTESNSGGGVEGITKLIKENPQLLMMLEKGGVVFTNYNGMEVMYEPNYNEYYVNDMKFDSMEEAKNYIDKGSRMDDKTIDAYRKGTFNDGGAIDGLSDLIYG